LKSIIRVSDLKIGACVYKFPIKQRPHATEVELEANGARLIAGPSGMD
jgi:hypothetical protein